MATNGNASARRVKIGFCGHRILVTAEVIPHIGQQLHQGNADVRHMALLPVRHHQRQTIQDQLAETGIILGQVVDLGLFFYFRRADSGRFAIEIAGAVYLETEIDTVIAWIKSGVGLPFTLLVLFDHAQGIGRKIARPIDRHLHEIVQFNTLVVVHGDIFDANITNASPSFNTHIDFVNLNGRFAQKIDRQCKLILVDLQIIEPVELVVPTHIFPPYIVMANQICHEDVLRTKVVPRISRVRLTRYWSSTRMLASSFLTFSSCTSISSPIHC